MRKTLGILAVLAFLVLVVGTGVFLFKKSAKKPVVYKTETPAKADIVKKTVATGSVVPRKEIAIKPQISGIVEELYVEAGQVLKQGDLVAKVRVIPNMVSLSAAEARVNQAQIALENAARENERQKKLYSEGTVAQSVYQNAETAWKTAPSSSRSAPRSDRSTTSSCAPTTAPTPTSCSTSAARWWRFRKRCSSSTATSRSSRSRPSHRRSRSGRSRPDCPTASRSR